jgi:hypothetical protein
LCYSGFDTIYSNNINLSSSYSPKETNCEGRGEKIKRKGQTKINQIKCGLI